MGIEVVAFEASHAQIAIEAFSRYGKGQGHPAQLTFGDCMTCTLAKQTGELLLCKGG